MNANLHKLLCSIPLQPCQDGDTLEQLRDLKNFAFRLGLFNAADFLRRTLDQHAVASADRREINRSTNDRRA